MTFIRLLKAGNPRCLALFLVFVFAGCTSGPSSFEKISSSEPDSNTQPAWSHDGQSLAFSANFNGNLDIFILNLITNKQVQMTEHPADDQMPSWSPDDSQIAFVSDRDGNDEYTS